MGFVIWRLHCCPTHRTHKAFQADQSTKERPKVEGIWGVMHKVTKHPLQKESHTTNHKDLAF